MGDVTQWLQQARDGDTAARDRLFASTYAEVLELSPATVKRDRQKARAFLLDALRD